MSFSIKQLKYNVRKDIKQRLANIKLALLKEQSQLVAQQLLTCPKFNESSRIGIYISLPQEVETFTIIKHIFNEGKECFIPRYNKVDMRLVKLNSIEDFESLPETSWKIKQPLQTEKREDAFLRGGLEYLIVPGLAFTKDGDRLGRGKGYYDRYLRELKLFHHDNKLKPTFTVGLAFKEQMVDSLPISEHDFKLDKVLYPQ